MTVPLFKPKVVNHGPVAFFWVDVKEQLPPNGCPVVVWCPQNEAMFFWSAESTKEMHDDFERLGFSYWVNILPPHQYDH